LYAVRFGPPFQKILIGKLVVVTELQQFCGAMAIDTFPAVTADAISHVPPQHSTEELDALCNVGNEHISSSEVEHNYDVWAANYEHETLDLYGFNSPSVRARPARPPSLHSATSLLPPHRLAQFTAVRGTCRDSI